MQFRLARGLDLAARVRADSRGRLTSWRTLNCQSAHSSPYQPAARRLLHCSSRVDGAIMLGRHVREALANGEPVVALESTVITHGLPEPNNLELALQLEREISTTCWRASDREGCKVVPATVAIIRGQPIVGLSRDELEFLASRERSGPIKASRRDIPLAEALKLSAGTTVSATMALVRATKAIHVFATGGLGGVHLGGERSLDISADLHEMGRSPMGVVSSGFKSFLDTRRSLEYLETMGCTVVSLRGRPGLYAAGRGEQARAFVDVVARRSQTFPGFFSCENRERVRSPWQCQSVEEAARILFHSIRDGDELEVANRRAMLLACPIPSDFSLDEQHYAELMEQVTAQVEQRPDLSGAEKTPLVLSELARLTENRTLEANLVLLRNNARVGAHLAYEHAALCQLQGEFLQELG